MLHSLKFTTLKYNVYCCLKTKDNGVFERVRHDKILKTLQEINDTGPMSGNLYKIEFCIMIQVPCWVRYLLPTTRVVNEHERRLVHVGSFKLVESMNNHERISEHVFLLMYKPTRFLVYVLSFNKLNS